MISIRFDITSYKPKKRQVKYEIEEMAFGLGSSRPNLESNPSISIPGQELVKSWVKESFFVKIYLFIFFECNLFSTKVPHVYGGQKIF